MVQQHGLLREDTNPAEAVVRPSVYVDVECTRNPRLASAQFYNTILTLRCFNALFHHPLVPQVVESLLAQLIFIHLRVICHLIFLGRPNYTAERHQDFAPVGGN